MHGKFLNGKKYGIVEDMFFYLFFMKSSPILIIKHGAFGDFIYSLGAMQAIANYHQGNALYLLTTPNFEELSKRSGLFEHIILDERVPVYNIKKWVALKKKLNEYRFARIYDLQGSCRTRAYYSFFFSRALGPWVAKFPEAELSWTNREKEDIPFYKHNACLLKQACGIHEHWPDLSFLGKSAFEDQFNESPFFVLIPGSSERGEKKRWNIHKYKQVASFFLEKGIFPISLCSNTEIIDQMEAIKFPGKLIKHPSCEDLAFFGKNAYGALGNDTGPTHFLAIVGCPIVMLFGEDGMPDKVCPPGSFPIHKNLDALTAEDVFDKIVSFLGKTLNPV